MLALALCKTLELTRRVMSTAALEHSAALVAKATGRSTDEVFDELFAEAAEPGTV